MADLHLQLLALLWPPLLVVPALAFLPALADRRAAAVEKRAEDEGADERRLLGELFSLASTAGPARELRTFGATARLLSDAGLYAELFALQAQGYAAT